MWDELVKSRSWFKSTLVLPTRSELCTLEADIESDRICGNRVIIRFYILNPCLGNCDMETWNARDNRTYQTILWIGNIPLIKTAQIQWRKEEIENARLRSFLPSWMINKRGEKRSGSRCTLWWRSVRWIKQDLGKSFYDNQNQGSRRYKDKKC